MQYSVENYTPLKKQLLACYWALVSSDHGTLSDHVAGAERIESVTVTKLKGWADPAAIH